MKPTLLLLFFWLITGHSFAQDAERVYDVLGYRLKYGGTDQIVYPNSPDRIPDTTIRRKLNYRYYFRLVDVPSYTDERTKKGYVMITIPGKTKEASQFLTTNKSGDMIDTRDFDGRPIDSNDYGRDFWIEESLVKSANTQYFPYRNDVCFGLLTIPFKLRPAIGERAPTLVNGSLNIGTYIGWKFRVSGMRDLFVCPVISGGVTSLTYNSANNSSISDGSMEENGFGLQYCGGVVFDFYKIQTGLVVGADYGTGDLAKGYVYQNNAWYSISINFNFLRPRIDKDVTNNE